MMKIAFASIVSLLLLMPIEGFTQQVIFCEHVDKSGTPQNSAKEFSIGPSGGFFQVLVKLKKELDSHSVIYDVYLVQDGKEVLNNSLRMSIKPGMTWFYKEITFFKPGEYHVYIYDERDSLLGVGQVTIRQQ